MGIYLFERSQNIPANRKEVWDFISSPANLNKITPPYMGFEILSPDLPEKMYPGVFIKYNVRPLLGIKMTWVTEITHVQEPDYFVDEQRIGPYGIWHHEHHLFDIEGGVLMKDKIYYQPPFGWLGDLANVLTIKGKLNEIFEFRRKALIQIFGEFGS